MMSINDYWLRFYTKSGLCDLCGNNGFINTSEVRSPKGHKVGDKEYCICPNGRSIRFQTLPILEQLAVSIEEYIADPDDGGDFDEFIAENHTILVSTLRKHYEKK